jgi:hypothetical protein
MAIQTRLQKATQGLTPLQRAVLVLKAMQEGREPDPDLRRISDAQQRQAFNRFVSLLWMTNHHIGAIVNITAHRVQLVEDAKKYFELFNEAAALLEEAEGVKRSRGYMDWRKREQITASEMLRSLAIECRNEGIKHLIHLWQELQAQQLVRDDIASEFEGEDPLLPAYREIVEEARAELLSAADTFSARKLLPEVPGDDFVSSYQAMVNEAFRQLMLAEPYA